MHALAWRIFAQNRILLCSLCMLAPLPAPQILPLAAHVHMHMLRLVLMAHTHTHLHSYFCTNHVVHISVIAMGAVQSLNAVMA